MARSGLKPPTQLPQFSKLHELSASENNVRTAMPPPPVTNGQKHTIGGCKERSKKLKTQPNLTTMIVPEPANKQRKITTQQSQPSSRLGHNSVKGSSLATLGNKQFSSSTSYSRQPSTSKTGSNHAFSYSTSGTSRPASVLAQSRPGSAMGHARANSVHATGRAATAMGYRGGIQSAQPDALQKSTTPSHFPNRLLNVRKLRSCNGGKNGQVTPLKSISASTTSASSRSSSTSKSSHRRSSSQPTIHPISLQEAARMDRSKFPKSTKTKLVSPRQSTSHHVFPLPLLQSRFTHIPLPKLLHIFHSGHQCLLLDPKVL